MKLGALLFVASDENSRLLGVALEAISEVVRVVDGAYEAIDLLRSCGEPGGPAPVDAVVCPLQASPGSGEELLLSCRGDRELASVPIVLVADRLLPAEAQRLVRLGADGLLICPPLPGEAELERKIRQALDRRAELMLSAFRSSRSPGGRVSG